MTNEEVRKAIEKYQKEHSLPFGTMLDVTAISSKEGADIISQMIERVSKKIDEDTELWCICEMAKMYMQGIKPVYPARQQGEWVKTNYGFYTCSKCGHYGNAKFFSYCPYCGADMRKPNCVTCDHFGDCDGCERSGEE